MTSNPPTPESRSGPLLTGLNALSAVADPDAPADTADVFTGEEADRYLALARLGEGGMGQVSLALDSRLRRQVALKVPRGPAARARLAREAFITAQLEHPGIVTVYDAGTQRDGEPFYTMRLVRGRSLEERLVAEPGEPPLRALLAACEAVGFAHDAGVVHRDLKPANIMVGEFGETIVVDWGLALTHEELAQHRGEVAGTPGYMSPEQRRGDTLDPRSDVWSLGAILYRMLSGHPPGAGTTRPETQAGLGPITPLTSLAPNAPRELVAIAERALAPDPAARYPHALALAKDLESWLLGRRVAAYAYSPLELLRRLVRAWRVPLAVGLVGLVALAILGALATDRVLTERDRAIEAEREVARALATADAHLGRALFGLAERHHEASEPAEAEVAAAAALTRLEPVDPPPTSARPAPPSPMTLEARGILANLDVPRPRLLSATPLPECSRRVISPQGEMTLCLDTGQLHRTFPTPSLVETYPTPIIDAALTSTHLFASHLQTWLSAYTLASAAPIVPELQTDSHPRLVVQRGPTPTLWRLWGFFAVAHIRTGPAPTDLTTLRYLACADTAAAVEAAVLGPEPPHPEHGRIAFTLCNDGVLRRLADSGRVVLDELPLHAHGRSVAATDTELFIATEPGRLFRVGTADGLALRWTVETRVNGVRSLHLSPDERLLAIGAEGRGVTVLDTADGHVLFRLPQSAGTEPRFDPRGELLTFAHDTVSRWALPPSPVASRIGQPGAAGLASFAVTDHEGRRHIVTGDGEGWVRVHDEAGLLRASRRFGDRVVKRVDAWKDRIWVSHFAADGVLELDLDLGADRPLGRAGIRSRRVAALSSGEVLSADYTAPAGRLLEGGYDPIGELVALDLAPSPMRDQAVLVGQDGRLAVYRAGSLRVLGTFAAARAAAIDDRGLVLVSADAVRWLDGDGAELSQITSAHEVLDVALGNGLVALARADGKTIACPREPDREPLFILGGHAKRVAQLDFIDDTASGSSPTVLLYSASWDGTVMRFRLGPIDPTHRLAEASAQWGLGLETLLD